MEKFDIVIYHGGCPDGVTSAWIFHHIFKGKDIQFLPYAHSQAPPDIDIIREKRVAIVDFSFSKDVIEKIIDVVSYLVIMDHHASAERELKDFKNPNKNFEIIFDMKRCGAQIVWDYFKPMISEWGYGRPWFIEYVADRDLWLHELPETREISEVLWFQGYFKGEISFPKIDTLLYGIPPGIVEKGAAYLEYKKRQISFLIKAAITTKFYCNDRIFTVRLASCPRHLRSDVGNILAEAGGCDFAALWSYDFASMSWWISLRGSEECYIDLSKIASIFGGGGHPKAAGFTIASRDGEDIHTYFKIEQRTT